ncbi:MAG TPA: hypothetical protein VGM60_13015 [Pseudonocardia sp.]|jgi:hypothetical protein|uniref:hypothetical protein n=1 Tax=Pseudonocardia sp. TaxID=60912 RepID=UPI002F3EF58A
MHNLGKVVVKRVVAGLGVALLAGCATAPAGPSPQDSARNTALCKDYASTSGSARTPLDAMRTQAVLSPFVALIEVGTRQIAAQGTAAPDPEVAGSMKRLVDALDDLDRQGQANLPPGANLTETPVRLDPSRLATALDDTDRACARYPARPPR